MVKPCDRQVRRRGGRLPGTLSARTQAGPGGPPRADGQKGHDMTEVSRRQILIGAAGLAAAGGLVACGSGSSPAPSTGAVVRRRESQAGRELPAGRHRRRFQGHHGRPEHHHQARPGPADDGLRDAAAVRRELPAHHQRPGRERDPGQPQAVHDQAAPGHRVPGRQAVYRGRRPVLVPAHRDQGQRAHRLRRHRHHGHQEHEEGGQVHGPAAAQDAGLDRPADPGQLHVRHGARRLQGVPGPAGRHRRLQAQVVQRPASRASTSATPTTGAAGSPTSTRSRSPTSAARPRR